MAVELVDRLAILVAVRRFPNMGAAYSRYLRSDSYAVCMRHFVRRATYVPFRRFLGDVRQELIQRPSLPLHGILDPIFATFCRRAVPMLRHAFLFLMLRFFPPSFYLVASAAFSFKIFSRIYLIPSSSMICIRHINVHYNSD
jgi:hypothetical protein